MNYVSLNRKTGCLITDAAHIQQSIEDILTTPIGTRVMRRDYGSELFQLLDQPHNGATRLRIMAAIITALTIWEPRVTIKQVELSQPELTGKLQINLVTDRNERIEVQYG
ncbi:GPW/gp25 family protein [Pseudoalteromonas luteoviolacea]|uniref:Baseplate assembly protein n=1 Tax=Pseudoalteromonas luteoviolacea NCIMB 1942 TaxID=1365253 RepID=A0A166Z6R0_9GAMM|nr:GPW/gp25 family protein [Pseudoalteromonas luteoviolacea]KZN43996.1 baseplate assembly protein [Pseudoalteromonas luteoviolacea NCIMB 1942]